MWVLAAATAAQPPSQTIPDDVACARCSLRATRTLRIGDQEGPGALSGFPSTVAFDSRSRLWVLGGGGLPKVFDSTGRFIQEVGRKGQGPGEFLSPFDAVALPGDSMLVVDAAVDRATVIDPSLTPRRTVLLPRFTPQPTIVLRWPDSVWVNANIPTAALAGFPIHNVSFASTEARVLKSFGPNAGELRAGGLDGIWQWLTPGSPGVWASYKLAYTLTHIDGAGRSTRELLRRPEWFASTSRPWMGNPETPPPPLVAALHQDAGGLLWVFVSVASTRWSEAWANVRVAGRAPEVSTARIAMDRLYHTQVEVIDPRAARVVARTRIESWIVSVLRDGRVASIETDADGRPHVQLWQLVLSGVR
jgi:hypothetical protein